MPRGIVLCNIVSALKIMSKLGEDRLLKKFGEQCEGIDLSFACGSCDHISADYHDNMWIELLP